MQVSGALRGVAAVISLAALPCIGCGPASPSPTLKPPPPTPPTITTYTISGTVAEASAPIAGARVGAWVQMQTGSWPINGMVSDGEGRFRLSNVLPGARVRLLVSKDGYLQQCAAGSLAVQSDMEVDLQLVSTANVTATVTSPPGFRSVSGTVVEITSTGKAPVGGAFVDFEPIDDVSAAYTVSDSSGQFALCGLPDNEEVVIAAWRERRFVYSRVPPGRTIVEITLP